MKVCLVTGANRGIGKEIARQLSEAGHRVWAGGRNYSSPLAETLAGKLEEGSIIEFSLDVNSDASVNAAAELIGGVEGKLDVLINNAGIGVGSAGITDPDIDEVKRIMETNFYGPMRMNKAFRSQLEKSEEGRIINLSSGMGAWDDLTRGYAGYRLSKTGLNAQTVLLSNELKDSSIKVNAMCPGWVRTDMGGANAHRSVEQGADTAFWLATAESIPSGKFLRDRKVIPW